jgi:hypothetical protein
MTKAHATIDHDRIKSWAEKRGGRPATVAATGDHGLLRIDFDPPDEKLEEVDWETFFDTFDEKSLAFLYQDKTSDGNLSRFSKFIDRNSAEAADLAEVADDESREQDKISSNGSSSRGSSSKSSSSAKPAKKAKAKSSNQKMDGAAPASAKAHAKSAAKSASSKAKASEAEDDDVDDDDFEDVE